MCCAVYRTGIPTGLEIISSRSSLHLGASDTAETITEEPLSSTVCGVPAVTPISRRTNWIRHSAEKLIFTLRRSLLVVEAWMLENSLSISNYLFGFKARPGKSESDDIRHTTNGRTCQKCCACSHWIEDRSTRSVAAFLSPGTKSWGGRMIGQPDLKLEMRGSSSQSSRRTHPLPS